MFNCVWEGTTQQESHPELTSVKASPQKTLIVEILLSLVDLENVTLTKD